jgi:hypothetical protein
MFSFRLAKMLLKELNEDLWPSYDTVEKPLHSSVAAAFSGSTGDTQHRYPSSHTQNCLSYPAHSS